MKRENLILIVHIILQIILFIPIIPFMKYYQMIDLGFLFIVLLGIINFIAYAITILNSENKFIIRHSTLIILFIIFTLIEDSILRGLVIGRHIELIIYSLFLLGNLELIYSLKQSNITRIIITIVISISALTIKCNYQISNMIFNFIVITLLISPFILCVLYKGIRKYYKGVTIFLQCCFIITFCLYKKYKIIESVSVSEYLLLSIISMELVLLYNILNTDIKKELVLFSSAMKKLFTGYIILFVMLLLIGIHIVSIVLLSVYFFIFLAEFRSYIKYKKYQLITFDEILDSYYYERYKDRELEKLNNLKIQTFLHDDILQIVIAIRRWIEDNLSGDGKGYILQNLDKLNDLIRHEIESFNPKLKNYNSLYEGYKNLIESLEGMYLDRQMLIEFECDKNIELPYPYDEIVYKCINELLINAFKHSKGYNTSITLKVVKGMIYLKVTNIGDYLEDKNKIKEGNIGLNILRLNLKQYRGVFEFDISNEDQEYEESYVQFKIKVPLDRSVLNANFVNRRS